MYIKCDVYVYSKRRIREQKMTYTWTINDVYVNSNIYIWTSKQRIRQNENTNTWYESDVYVKVLLRRVVKIFVYVYYVSRIRTYYVWRIRHNITTYTSKWISHLLLFLCSIRSYTLREYALRRTLYVEFYVGCFT